jgi:Rps23 Pro-64 3,4-dihydroxylase Tpa1-like proline 4-hydroxylase
VSPSLRSPILNRAELLDLGRSKAQEFREAQPFPHIVIDDFLPPELITSLIRDFPAPDATEWLTYNTKRELKLAMEDESRMPQAHIDVLREFNGQFVEFLEELTGISGLIADPQFRGGGLHQIMPGGMLKLHADFDMHPRMKVHRRLNAILYLNEDWQPSYSGGLELWNKDASAMVKSIEPLANRLMVFETTDDSFHGHPDPLTCPEGRSRCSMAWYYYTALPADSARTGRTPIWAERPGEKVTTRTEDLWAKVLGAVPPSVKETGKRLLNK